MKSFLSRERPPEQTPRSWWQTRGTGPRARRVQRGLGEPAELPGPGAGAGGGAALTLSALLCPHVGRWSALRVVGVTGCCTSQPAEGLGDPLDQLWYLCAPPPRVKPSKCPGSLTTLSLIGKASEQTLFVPDPSFSKSLAWV